MKSSTPIVHQNGHTQHPPPPIDHSKESDCRKICTERFTFVIFYSIAAQYILLLIFLFLVNLQLLHPILWIKSTFFILFSFYTWLWTLPLIFTIAIYGIFNLKPYLKPKEFHGSRFVSFYKNFVQQLIILMLNALIGFLTAHLYIKYLKEDYRVFKLKTEVLTVLNEKHLFLLLSGLYMGVYYFFKRRAPQLIIFPVVQQSKYVLLRQQFYATLKASMVTSLMPVTKFVLFFTVTSKILIYLTSAIFFLDIEEKSFWDGFSILMDARLMLFVWILSSQILSNMDLMYQLTNILATEPKQFPIEDKGELTLCEALSFNKFQITQQLAAQDLFLLSERANGSRRIQFYSLSIPGGHPNNWKQLVAQSLSLIDNYSSELSKSIEKITINKNNNKCPPFFKMQNPTLSNEVAEKLLVRQYNENYGIRSMAETPLQDQAKVGPPTFQQTLIKNLNEKVEALKKRVQALPIVFYCFGEAENAKLCFLLVQQSQQVVWTSLGLATIIAASLKEDNYGVVQNDIKRILKALLRLKSILDKISSVNLGDKKIDRNYFALKSSIKRAVYKIVTVFSKYFDDLNMDADEVRALQPFVFFKEL